MNSAKKIPSPLVSLFPIAFLVGMLFATIHTFGSEVPGAAARDCGNYLDMNLPMAKYLAGKFYDEVLEDIREEQLVYPE